MNHNSLLYIGIDVSKDKHDICIKNTDRDLNKLYTTVDKLKSNTGENTNVLFGMEATGVCCFPLYSALKRDGYPVRQILSIQPSLQICCVIRNRLLQLQLIIWYYIN